MSQLRRFLLFSSIFVELSFPKSVIRFRRQQSDCKDTVALQDCTVGKNDEDGTIHLLRMKSNQIIAHYETECDFDGIKYHWLVRDENGNDVINTETNTNTYILHPFALKTEVYGVMVTVTLTRKESKKELEASCLLSIDALDPLPIIKGGTERTVEATHSFIMDGSKSIDRDVPTGTPPKLSYKWQCQVLDGQEKTFCANEYHSSTLVVPPSTNQKYLFTLSVKSDDSNTWVSTTQTVTVLAKVAELEIVCEKNCPPAAPLTVAQRLTFLRVICRKNCEGVDEKDYTWTVDGNFDYQNTQYGRNSDKFIVKEDVFKPGLVKIRVDLKGGGSATETLNVEVPLKIDSCEAKPPQGVAINTTFKVECKYTGEGYSFEILTKKKGKVVVLNRNYKLEGLEFVLPVGTDVYVRITDAEDFSDEYKLNVQVSTGDTSEAEISRLNASIPSLIKRGDTDLAVQITNGLIEALDAQDPSNTTKEIKMSLLKNFQDIRIKSQAKARQIAQLVARLVHDPKSESDPYRGEIASEICKESALVDYKEMAKGSAPKALTRDTLQATKTLLECVETDAKPNPPIMVPEPLPFAIPTTPYPPLPLPVIEENYPDYETDESVWDKTKKYDITSSNFVVICKTNLAMLALTVVEGEKTVVVSAEDSSAQITRLVGKELAKSKIDLLGGSFQPSRDVGKVEEAVDVRVCCWRYDPFWWTKWLIVTNVYLLRVVTNDEILRKFEEPNKVVLDLRKEQDLVVLPVIKKENLVVVRVDVKAREAFFVELRTRITLRVLITVFEKPEEGEIHSKGVKITGTKQLYYDYDRKYDAWCYISVVPQKAGVISFDVSVYSASCFSWNYSKRKWSFACKSTAESTIKKITCLCNHLSILAGVVHNNTIRIDEVKTKPEFKMILLSSPVIFITLVTILLLYLFSLVLMLGIRRVKKMPVYLPPDISTYSRYVYLVCIKTGRKPSSGTSSNICIKIFGQKTSTKSHLLNYPDPQKRIFQWGNNDWFLVPNISPLGELTEVALWSDYTGRTPRWYCTNVTIYDIQTGQKWYFKFNKWFDVPPKHQTYNKVGVGTPGRERGWGRKLRFWPRRLYQADLDLFLKTNFLLSVVLMICMATLIMYGLPRLVLADGFGWFCEYGFQWSIVLIGFGSSGITFIAHLTWLWLYRNKTRPKTVSLVVLTVNVVTSVSLLVVFGFWKPLIMGWFWLTSVLLAIVLYFLLWENLFEVYIVLKSRRHIAEDDPNLVETFKRNLGQIEVQRRFLFKTFGEHLLRPYFGHLYTPMEEEQIKVRKAQFLSRLQLLTLIEDTMMFICYVAILYLVIFANKNPLTVYNHLEMADLLKGVHTRTGGFSEISSIDEFYDYLNETLIPTMHSQHWYHKYVVKEPGIMADFNNKFLGVARLRQKRTEMQPCRQLYDFVKNETCHDEYMHMWSNTSTFIPNYNEFDRMAPIWNYTKAYKGGLSLVWGQFGWYWGGGFIAPFGRTSYNSYANFFYVVKNVWIDRATSVIMIEFLTYNVNSNLFNAVRVVSERSATGYTRNFLDLSTAQYLFVQNEDAVAELVILGSFFVIVVFFTIKLVTRAFTRKLFFFRDLWTLIDVVIVGVTYVCFLLFIGRMDLVNKFLLKVEKAKKNEFINFYGLLFEDKSFTYIAAFLIFISTIRLWKMLRVGTFFKIVEKTIIIGFPTLFILMINHRVCIGAFTFTGVMIFGSYSENFKDVMDVAMTLLILSLGVQGDFDFDVLIVTNPLISRVYYIAYMFCNLLFSTMYVAVLIDCYYKAQVIVASDSELTTLTSFIFKEVSFYKTWLKVGLQRLKSGTTPKRNKVTPKPEEYRYKNCVTIQENTLELMCCIGIRALKKFRLSKEEKLGLMHRVVRCVRRSDQTGIFFTEKTPKGIKVIPDENMKRIERAVELILDPQQKWRKLKEERFKKIVKYQMDQLNYFNQVLETIVRLVSNIEVE